LEQITLKYGIMSTDSSQSGKIIAASDYSADFGKPDRTSKLLAAFQFWNELDIYQAEQQGVPVRKHVFRSHFDGRPLNAENLVAHGTIRDRSYSVPVKTDPTKEPEVSYSIFFEI
jgi:hypothetical protein